MVVPGLDRTARGGRTEVGLLFMSAPFLLSFPAVADNLVSDFTYNLQPN